VSPTRNSQNSPSAPCDRAHSPPHSGPRQNSLPPQIGSINVAPTAETRAIVCPESDSRAGLSRSLTIGSRSCQGTDRAENRVPHTPIAELGPLTTLRCSNLASIQHGECSSRSHRSIPLTEIPHTLVRRATFRRFDSVFVTRHLEAAFRAACPAPQKNLPR
jgi:hypothetical protein